jgi:hypothetical protein
MAKWKPSVGDKFTYERIQRGGYYTPGQHRDTGSRRDTIVMEIVQSDTMYDSLHSVVAVEGWSQGYFFFSRGFDSLSDHSFAVSTLPIAYNEFDLHSDFSQSRDSQALIGSHHLTAYRSNYQRGIFMAAVNSQNAIYSPQIRWFTYLDNSTDGIHGPSDLTIDEFESESLLVASSLGVNASPALENNDFTVYVNGGLLHVSFLNVASDQISFGLMDPLGRPVRSWQLAANDGPREISLNVADVPSGVYFLRLRGGGLDEVKRVAIIH